MNLGPALAFLALGTSYHVAHGKLHSDDNSLLFGRGAVRGAQTIRVPAGVRASPRAVGSVTAAEMHSEFANTGRPRMRNLFEGISL
jgi:hypothetical protein